MKISFLKVFFNGILLSVFLYKIDFINSIIKNIVIQKLLQIIRNCKMDTHDLKVTYLTEESLQMQRVEVFMKDLRERLKQLSLQHDKVIQDSVGIINEINCLSTTLRMAEEQKKGESVTKIQKLIKEFEISKDKNANKIFGQIDDDGVDIHKLLMNIHKFNESQVIKDSLAAFKCARDSFEKIDDCLAIITDGTTDPMKLAGCCGNTIGMSENLRHRINMFNSVNDKSAEKSTFSSCCSSYTSLDTYQSVEELPEPAACGVRSNNSMGYSGYEGDVDDSEIDLLEEIK